MDRLRPKFSSHLYAAHQLKINDGSGRVRLFSREIDVPFASDHSLDHKQYLPTIIMIKDLAGVFPKYYVRDMYYYFIIALPGFFTA